MAHGIGGLGDGASGLGMGGTDGGDSGEGGGLGGEGGGEGALIVWYLGPHQQKLATVSSSRAAASAWRISNES